MIDSIVAETDAASVDRTTSRARTRLARLRAADWTPFLLLLLVVTSFGFRLIWLEKPDGALIFDESYYVNAACVMLGWPVEENAP